MVTHGDAIVITGMDNVLTRFNENVVVQMNAESSWTIRPVTTEHFIMILHSPGCEEDMVATLESTCDSGEPIPVVLRKVQDPPAPEQLWSMHEGISQPRHPPIDHGRIQSVAKCDMSLAVAGVVPLPRIMLGVAAVPTEGYDKEKLRWRFDYTKLH